MRAGESDLNITDVIARLRDADQVVRLHAATVLGSLGAKAAPAVPALIEMLIAGDIHDQRMTALALGSIGPVAAEAVPALLEAADDDDDGLSDMAIWALEEIDLLPSAEDEVA